MKEINNERCAKSPKFCLKVFPVIVFVSFIVLLNAINRTNTISKSYGKVTKENRNDTTEEISIAVNDSYKLKGNIYNSVLDDRELRNNWPNWTYDDYLQPWVNREQEETRNKSDDEQRRRRFPNVLCIGVKKCGTTALQNFLRQHPKVIASKKEIHFFDSEKFSKGLDSYRNHFKPSTAGEIVMDKSPRYFFSAFVPGRVWEWNRNVKLIVVVCDPVMRTFSDYNYDNGPKAFHKKKFKTFDDLVTTSIHDIETIKQDPLGTLGYPTFNSFIRNAWNERMFQVTVLTHGMYSIHLRDWFTLFNKNQIHVVDGDELIRDPGSSMKKVQTFLGIEQFLTKDSFYFDEEKGFFCHKGDSCLIDTKGTTRKKGASTMAPETHEKLRRFFKPYNEELFIMLNCTFDWV